jgi:membrane-associated phospholipid phosphatase
VKIAILLSLQILFSLAVFIIVVSILVFIIRKPIRKHKATDLAVFEKLDHIVTPARTRFMLFITFLGNHKFLVPANLLLILYFLFIRQQSWFSIRVAAIALSSLILMLLLKQLFRRRRPLAPLLKAAKGLSFPSGHAIMSTSFYGLIIYIIYHMLGISVISVLIILLLAIIILLIGFSRVYLRVHYASDVLAGFAIGLVWLLISLTVVNQVEEQVNLLY